MEKVIYTQKGGQGIILQADEKESDYLMSKDFMINGFLLKTGDRTNLFGLFTEPLKYAGVLKEQENCMCFMIGEGDANLFDVPTFYYCFHWISENRLANKYSNNTSRDFKWINGGWK